MTENETEMTETVSYTCVKIDFTDNLFYVKYYGTCISTLYLFPRKLKEETFCTFAEAKSAQEQATSSVKILTEAAVAHMNYAGSIQTSGART